MTPTSPCVEDKEDAASWKLPGRELVDIHLLWRPISLSSWEEVLPSWIGEAWAVAWLL